MPDYSAVTSSIHYSFRTGGEHPRTLALMEELVLPGLEEPDNALSKPQAKGTRRSPRSR
jgi:hypothetical protein